MPSKKHICAGQKYGRLTVLRPTDDNGHVFLCSCSCGKEHETSRRGLLSGASSSCGCLRRERATEAAREACLTHGMTHTKEYKAWAAMINRTRPNSKDRSRYSDRGIHVWPGWKKRGGFQLFLSEVGRAPSPHHSLDRKNNNRGYEPGNLRWATIKQQARNRRDNRFVTAFGRTQTLADWVDETHLKYATVQRRLNVGWSPERALSATLGCHYRMEIDMSRVVEILQTSRSQKVEIKRSKNGLELTLFVAKSITTRLFESVHAR